MPNPATVLPEAMAPIQALLDIVRAGGVAEATLALVHLRVSQINGCSSCVDGAWRSARAAGESEERLFAVSAWRHAPYFSDAERAALALAEAVTRLPDREDPVPDAVWNEAACHFEQRGLAALLLQIGLANLFNRANVATAQVAGAWG